MNAELRQLEIELGKLSSDHPLTFRKDARLAFQKFIEMGQKTATLSDALERASTRQADVRAAALATIRVVGTGLLDFDGEDAGLQRHIVRLAEQGATDICKFFKLAEYKQNFEKVQRLASIHGEILTQLDPVRLIGSTQQAFLSTRTDIMRVLNREIIRSYLAPYGLASVTQSVQAVFSAAEELLETRTYEFPTLLSALRSQVSSEIEQLGSEQNFFATDYALPFFKAAERFCSTLDKDAREKFTSKIVALRDPSQLLEKRYPLHDVGRTLSISLPFVNEGPGIAQEVTARLTAGSDSLAANDQRIRIGDILPGSFVLLFEVLVLEVLAEAEIWVEIQWGEILSKTRQNLSLTIPLRSQSDSVDWEKLADSEPYSLEVAEGEEFVGRQNKVRSIAARLLRPRMVSSYITGQKRIGKSSLSLAVQDHVQGASPTTKVLTLDRGDYAHEDPRATLRVLGERISEFFLESLLSENVVPLSFDGTLAPLNRLADRLFESNPQSRYVVILDEFDGIHPELYRSGALAETFFSNLRTLSAKRNVAFILVGGENMPFIIAAQGDELNKFSHESLTYFSRVTEWEDFVALVQRPVEGQIKWYDSALNALFDWTNGHPYYTKLVCAEIFRRAIQERDADVTSSEVEFGVTRTIGSLDTNSFAHLWKDGIGGSREEAEVVSLRRCRVLIAIGRALREGLPLTLNNILAKKGLGPLTDIEVANTAQEFCTRRILNEESGHLQFTLPIFREWLKQSGANTIIPDLSADDLAADLNAAEQQAYVRDDEILSVTSKWPPYYGREVSPVLVRSWLDQVQSRVEQRMLFKLLKRLKFWSDIGVRESLMGAHRLVARSVTPFVKKHRADQRNDIIVTYVDGPAKSGAEYARRYAEDNSIAAYCVLEMGDFASRLQEHEERFNVNTRAIIIVDDIIGTGKTLTENIQRFMQKNREAIQLRNPAIRIVAVCATSAGQQRVREKLRSFDGIDIDLIISTPLAEDVYSFTSSGDHWDSVNECEMARALVRRIGSNLVKAAPLGFGDQALLVVFPQTCPNNSLPILYGTGTKDFPWKPLFPRPVN